MTTQIDTDAFSRVLRERGIDAEEKRVLVSDLRGSEMAEDLSVPPNCGGFGRIRHFHRATAEGWPDNPLPIDPAARALVRPAEEMMLAQVFQNAVCNWRCWYCYVDYPLLAGNSEHSAMFTADELLDAYLAAEERPLIIDLSGGQPDLVPEWVVWMAQALEQRGLDREVYLWSDDNLSNDYFWTKLSGEDRLALEGFPNYGKVCCFKGFDAASFAFNTGADPGLFQRQFELFERLLNETSLDLYGYATFTSPKAHGVEGAMGRFVDSLQRIDEVLPLRVVPLRIEAFGPTEARVGAEHELAMQVQDFAAAAWNAELVARFGSEVGGSIVDVELRNH